MYVVQSWNGCCGMQGFFRWCVDLGGQREGIGDRDRAAMVANYGDID